MKSICKLILAGALLASATPFVNADDSHHAAASTQENGATAAAGMSEGEIKKVDKEAGKITIKHGELKNLGMPPMTMIFRVKDKALLDQVKQGDKINFVAEKVNGKLTVMQITPIQ
jgi:Cu(I)/Ag(I) efflux system periplasmic protein CusF